MNGDKTLCSISSCLSTAVETEHGESEHWTFVIYYCYEHAREIAKGTPVGPVGVEACRVDVISRGEVTPRVGSAFQAIGP